MTAEQALKLEHIEQKIESFNDNMEAIISAIQGNKITKLGGMVADIKETKQEMREIKLRLDQLEKFKDKWSWSITLIVAISGFLGTAIGLLLAYLNFSKH